MAAAREPKDILLESVDRLGSLNGAEGLNLKTNVGTIVARYHEPSAAADGAVVWVGGAGGGLDGPAGGLYPRLAGQLSGRQIASLRIHYRHPNDLTNCVIDTLLAVQFLRHRQGHRRIALVGHSFGGAVVISAGVLSEAVVAVAALSSQTYGTDLVAGLSPRPLLLMHGTADEILPDRCSRLIYQRAAEPKEILLYAGCRHGLDECRQEVDRDLLTWLIDKLQ